MTDRIDEAIAASLQRILNVWNPNPASDPADYIIHRLEDAIQEEIEWLRS